MSNIFFFLAKFISNNLLLDYWTLYKEIMSKINDNSHQQAED